MVKPIKKEIPPPWYEVPPRAVFVWLALVAVVVAAYWQILDNPIFFDTAQNFGDSVLAKYWSEFDLLAQRSLSLLTFGALYQVIGMDWYWHHLVNIFFHAAAVVLLCSFFKLVFEFAQRQGQKKWQIHCHWMAFFGALLFALHPLGVYAVGYLIQRTIVMATLFGLLALIFYFRAITTNKWHLHIGVILSYFAALHSKEHIIALPAVFVLLAIYVRVPWRDFFVRHAWVFVFLAALAIQSTIANIGIVGSIHEPHGAMMLEVIQNETTGVIHPLLLSCISQANYFFRYLYLWIVPYLPWISIDIQLPMALKPISWPYTAGAVAFIAYTVTCFYLLVRGQCMKRLLALGLLFPVVLFSTEFVVLRLSEVFVLYRSYLWMAGFFLILPVLFALGKASKGMVAFKISVFGLYALSMAVILNERLNTFDDSIALWQDVVDKVPSHDNNALYKSYRGYNNLAFAQTAVGKIDEAIVNYYKSIQIYPGYVKARSNLGAVLTNKGRYHEAMRHFQHAIDIEPTYVDAIVGLGVCAAEQGLNEEAIGYYTRALGAAPGHPDALYNMGNAYMALGQNDKAIEKFIESLKSKPSFADAHHNLGIVYAKIGKNALAIVQFQEALKYNPNHPLSAKALEMLGVKYVPAPVQPKTSNAIF